MSYCTVEDVKQRVTEARIINLTDDAGTGTVNEDLIQEVIDAQALFMDGYLRGRYTLPLNIVGVEPVLNLINKNLTLVELEQRRSFSLSKNAELLQSQAMQMLKDIQGGKLILALALDTPTKNKPTFTLLSDKKVIFTDKLLDEMP